MSSSLLAIVGLILLALTWKLVNQLKRKGRPNLGVKQNKDVSFQVADHCVHCGAQHSMIIEAETKPDALDLGAVVNSLEGVSLMDPGEVRTARCNACGRTQDEEINFGERFDCWSPHCRAKRSVVIRPTTRLDTFGLVFDGTAGSLEVDGPLENEGQLQIAHCRSCGEEKIF